MCDSVRLLFFFFFFPSCPIVVRPPDSLTTKKHVKQTNCSDTFGKRQHSASRCVGRRLVEPMEKLRGYDRRPTDEEALGPPDQRPWTEYDGRGDKQLKPPFKALGVGPCLCFGPTCCVLELQWPEWLCNRPSFEPGDCYGWDGCFEVRCSQWLTRLQIG